jgi:hypothetical protein
LGLGSKGEISLLFVDLNWSVLFRYERGAYSIEHAVESNDPGIVGSIMEEMAQRSE